MTCLISLMPDITALKGTNSERVFLAIRRARVVLPQPGGPQKSMETMSSRSICVRRGLPGASKSSWPRTSSSVRGRMRSARGRELCEPSFSGPSGSMARKRFMAMCRESFEAATLARGFVKNQRRGDSGVQGVYRLRKLDANQRVGAAFDFRRQAGAFVADENRDGLAKIEFVGVARGGIFRRTGGDNLQAGDAELRERDGSGKFDKGWKPQSRTSGGAQRFWRIRMRRAFCGDDSRGAEGFGGAKNSADVAGVLHADRNYDEGVEPSHQIVEGELRRAQKSGDALRSFRAGDGVEKLVRRAQDESWPVEFGDKSGQGFFGGGAGENGFKFEAGANGVRDKTDAFEADALVFRARGVENRAKKFEPVIFARSDGRALRGARRRGFT